MIRWAYAVPLAYQAVRRYGRIRTPAENLDALGIHAAAAAVDDKTRRSKRTVPLPPTVHQAL
jgi:hypothetical protein